jgi:peptidylprolyl isomerase/FKBP-type peptidyl-prolyl cis-trans isomerase FkpA
MVRNINYFSKYLDLFILVYLFKSTNFYTNLKKYKINYVTITIMEESKFKIVNFLGYVLLIGLATAVIIYVLNYSAKPQAVIQTDTNSQKEVVAEPSPIVENNNMQENVTELKMEDLVVGTGAEAVSGKVISVHYTGTLTNGTKFDSSKDRGTPFEFTLGAGEVIQGWDKGFAGMKVGGKRKLTIPSDMGYGAQGAGGVIPPNATLIFEVELLDVK